MINKTAIVKIGRLLVHAYKQKEKDVKTLAAITFVLLLLYTGMAQAAVHWSVADGGNGHWYDLIFHGQSWGWNEANSDSRTHSLNGVAGHLATITSAEENQFITEWLIPLLPSSEYYWIGGYQISKDDEPAGNWAWVTGEDWEYTNWYTAGVPVEPSNSYNVEDYLEFVVHLGGGWNDLPAGSNGDGGDHNAYIIEYDTEPNPVPLPTTMFLLGTGLAFLNGLRRKFNK